MAPAEFHQPIKLNPTKNTWQDLAFTTVCAIILVLIVGSPEVAVIGAILFIAGLGCISVVPIFSEVTPHPKIVFLPIEQALVLALYTEPFIILKLYILGNLSLFQVTTSVVSVLALACGIFYFLTTFQVTVGHKVIARINPSTDSVSTISKNSFLYSIISGAPIHTNSGSNIHLLTGSKKDISTSNLTVLSMEPESLLNPEKVGRGRCTVCGGVPQKRMYCEYTSDRYSENSASFCESCYEDVLDLFVDSGLISEQEFVAEKL